MIVQVCCYFKSESTFILINWMEIFVWPRLLNVSTVLERTPLWQLASRLTALLIVRHRVWKSAICHLSEMRPTLY